MATELIEAFAGRVRRRRSTRTRYRDALCEIIKAKRKGKEVHRPEPVEEEEARPT